MLSRSLSIKKKITLSFTALLLFMSNTAIISYVFVQKVEKKVHLVEVIDDFFNLTLELRRFEKNYFLYKHNADYKSNLSYLDKLDKTLTFDAESLTVIFPVEKQEKIKNILAEYREKITRLYELNKEITVDTVDSVNLSLQQQIRDTGQELTKLAELLASSERTSIKILLKTSRTVLIASIGLLFILSFAMAMLLGKDIVSSLQLLESYTKKVAHGEMINPPKMNAEMEVHSLFRAFNRMNNELQLRQRQMVQSEKLASMGTLLAGVAHELNNPLSNISTSAQILAEEFDETASDFQKLMVEQIEGQTVKARDIVRTLLEFSRTKEFSKQDIVLRKMIEEALYLLHAEIPSEVEVNLEISEDLHIWADKQRMQQVFLNLIKNAVDAMGDHGKLWISAKEIKPDKKDGEVEILVTDTGEGIKPELLKKIFDPFYTSKDLGKGSGLGLFIVHDIIEIHGGTITVDSRLGEGTTFVIWLPGAEENT